MLLALSISYSVAANETTINSNQPIPEVDYSYLPGPATEISQVTLYCWLGSKSCFILETVLSQWAGDKAILLRHQPLIKRPAWRRLAKARLVAQLMDVETEFVNHINQHLHQDMHSIESDEDLFALVSQTNISASRFSNLFYAAETNQQLNNIQDLAATNNITGIPTITINNQWLISARMHKTSRKILQTVEQLLGLSD